MAELYSEMPDKTPSEAPSPPAILLVRWLVVGLPLAWGIIETLKKSLALFH